MAHETRNRATHTLRRPGYRSPHHAAPAGDIAQVRVSVRRFDPEKREVTLRRGPRHKDFASPPRGKGGCSHTEAPIRATRATATRPLIFRHVKALELSTRPGSR